MTYREYKFLVLSDLYRITGNIGVFTLIKMLMSSSSYKYVFWMRTCLYTRRNRLLKYFIYPFARFIFYRLTYKYGIAIPYNTIIGSGFYIGHFGGIVVSPKCRIGNNCNISQCVTIGQSNRGRNKGYPILGDNIYIGPGAKIFGAVKIGNNVAIGANCVVTKDIPGDSVVVGVPGKVISQEGSKGYIVNTEYTDKIKSIDLAKSHIKTKNQ